MLYHVSINGNDQWSGTAQAPFRTINHAAQIAVAGDTVCVHKGTYREWVDPQNGGTDEAHPIVYRAADKEHPVIKGSEEITDWKKETGSVWKKTLPNTFFGEYNPYATKLQGDWLQTPKDYPVHLGDVYLNGVSMFEASSFDDLYKAEERHTGCQHYEAACPELILHPEQTRYRWYAEVDNSTTTIYCNFQEKDPNLETVEINVRKACFYPKQKGRNYITLCGFEIAHAACPWAPPTADQTGMVGPNWSKGWIIENCDLHDAKCSAISIGRGDSFFDIPTAISNRRGHYWQLETVFCAWLKGWNRETVGSHVIRNNRIHDCGQNGIVGNLGCIFSKIEHNHIYNIGIKHEFWGDELGGIKLHAAIDVIIGGNHIHNCTLGTWLDWQAQGTRVTKNIYHHNNRDFMIEVTHGPCTVDNNIFLSDVMLENVAQGTAFVYNLCAGVVRHKNCLDRHTPYHVPHSTDIVGCINVSGGDDKLLNNIFLGVCEPPADYLFPMSVTYDTLSNRAVLEGNVYSGYAKPANIEKQPTVLSKIDAYITEDNGTYIFSLSLPEELPDNVFEIATAEKLGCAYVTQQPYTEPDGSPISFDEDIVGEKRGAVVYPGPFAGLRVGTNSFVIWTPEL